MTSTFRAFVMMAAFSSMMLSCKGKKTPEPPERPSNSASNGERAEETDRVEFDEEALRNLRLVIHKVEARDLAPALEVTAELVPDPDRRAEVGARTAARVIEFKVRAGDHVERGAIVAVLESAEVGKARAELSSALARAEVALTARDRERSLSAVHATSQKDVQEAEARAKTADTDVAASRTLLATLGVGASDVAEAGDPARVLVRSPIRGVVVSRKAHVGQSIDPTVTLVEVVDLDRLWLDARVYERDLRFVAPGQEVQLETRAYPGELFRGKVDRVGDTLDEKTRAVTVRVQLPNPSHRLKPGMFATARIIGTRANEPRRMIAVPLAAIQEIDGHASVFVRDGERAFELRRVHTGERSGDLVEILNGVQQGDEVVGDGSFVLKGELLKSTLGEAE